MIALLWATLAISAWADQLDHWRWREPLPQFNTLNAVIYANNQYVAVGSRTALASPDLNSWTPAEFKSVNVLYGLTVRGGTYVAVGASGKILLSTDGVNWAQSSSPTSNLLFAVTDADGLFVAVGSSGTILTSVDGWNWTSRKSGVLSLNAVTYFNGKFVVVGDNGTILTSENGVTWTKRTGPNIRGLYGITSGNGLAVAVGDSGTILSSPDGITWTVRSSPSTSKYYSVAFNNARFVTVADGYSATSTDGIQWSGATNSGSTFYQVAAGANGSFVAVGKTGVILTSTNGLQWTRKYSSTNSAGFDDIAYGNGIFVVAGEYRILRSTDGASWTRSPSTPWGSIEGICFANGLFVAVAGIGGEGSIHVSSDGITWVDKSLPNTPNLTDVVYDRGVFVVVGELGAVLTSVDGMTWVRQTTNLTSSFTKIAVGNNLFVAIAYDTNGDLLLASPDGITWSPCSYGAKQALNGVAYGNGRYLVTFPGGYLSSTDAVNWTTTLESSYPNFNHITYCNGRFIMTASFGVLQTSTDGINWLVRNEVTHGYGFHAVVYGNDSYVAVSNTSPGGILQSLPGPTAATVALLSNPQSGGTTSGAGVYSEGDAVTLEAAPHTGYRFVNWTEEGAVVSTSPAYPINVDSSRVFVANFRPTTFATWQTVNFSTSQLNNPAVSGPAAVPAADNLQNLMKYAIGLAPWTSSKGPVLGSVTSGGLKYLTLQFGRSPLATDITYEVQASSNLADPDGWAPVATFSGGAWLPAQTVTETVNGSMMNVKFIDSVSISSTSRRYLRLVTKP